MLPVEIVNETGVFRIDPVACGFIVYDSSAFVNVVKCVEELRITYRI